MAASVSPARPVTAVVVSWNTRTLLDRCLTALGAEADVAVHVVDNASTDGSGGLVRDRHPGVVLHEPGVNLGYGAAIERVAAATESPWLLLVNADAAPRPGAVAALLAAGAADPSAGALVPRLRLSDGTDQHAVHPFPTLGFLAAFNAGLTAANGDALCLEGRWDAGRERVVPWAVAACLLVRRTAFDDAGGFDRAMWLYAEDLDLGWRLRRAGWHTRHVPGAVVDHASAASTAQAWGDERTRRWQAATYRWLRRRRGPGRARGAYVLNLLGASARARWAREGWRRDAARGWARTHRQAWADACHDEPVP